MSTLIVYTHPNHKSFTYAMYNHIIKGLDRRGEVHKTIDLYADGFNPALVFNEEKRRRDMHLDPELNHYREAITWADQLIFVYPIFWGRPPAMLLGFIDRLFAAHFAYEDTNNLFPKQLLKGKKAICVSCMKGPNHYLQLWLGNSHQLLMKRSLFDFVGISPVKFFEFGNIERTGNHKIRYLNKLETFFAKN